MAEGWAAMIQDETGELQTGSNWMVGGIAFAASLMVMAGSFSIVAGIAAVFDDGYVVVRRRYPFDLGTTAWGWIHLVLGIAVVVTGFCLFANYAWAGIVALLLSVVSAVDHFFFIPYAPFWSILIIALNVWVIWALTQTRKIRSAEPGEVAEPGAGG
jgi:hypothetical protein